MFRVCLGLVILLDLFVNKWSNIDFFYTETGVYPQVFQDFSIEKNPFKAIQKLGILTHINTSLQVKIFFVITGISALFYTIGYKTKWLGTATFFMLLSIHMRNPYVLSGPDELIISLLAWSLFLPLNNNLKSPSPKLTSVASVGLIIQIALIYFYNADLKNGYVWEQGNGLSYALMEDLWTKPSAEWLLQFPDFCRWLSKGTIFIEYAVPALLIIPYKREFLRFLAAILLVVLHGTIFSFLTLGLFPIIASTIVVVILPSKFWDKVFKTQPKETDNNGETKPFQHLNIVFSSLFLVLIFWKSIISHNHGDNIVYHPRFMKYLNETTLFRQYWAMYAPNPTLNPSWYKVAVLTEDGQFLDAKSENTHKDDLSYLEDYKNYTWSLFFYWTYVYPDQLAKSMIERWVELEKQSWDKNHPKNKAQYVYIYGYKKRIAPNTEVAQPEKQVITISK